MAKIKITRGIETGSGENRIRHEAGKQLERSTLEKQFGKKVVAHWIKTGVLKGGSDGG